jgi:hypothetical protein
MKFRILRPLMMLCFLALLTACPNPPPAEESCNFVQNSFQRRVSWTRVPVKMYIDTGSFAGPNEDLYYRAIAEAMDVWNSRFERPVLELVGRTEDLPPPRLNGVGRVIPDGYNGIYRVDPEVFQNTNGVDEQARTSISFRGDFIYEADVLIDASEQFYFDDVSIQSSEQRIQFKSLMIHEFGHVLGLGHVEDESVGSVMFPKLQFGQMRPEPVVEQSSNGPDVVRLELPEIDAQSLSCEYQ